MVVYLDEPPSPRTVRSSVSPTYSTGRQVSDPLGLSSLSQQVASVSHTLVWCILGMTLDLVHGRFQFPAGTCLPSVCGTSVTQCGESGTSTFLERHPVGARDGGVHITGSSRHTRRRVSWLWLCGKASCGPTSTGSDSVCSSRQPPSATQGIRTARTTFSLIL